MWTFWNFISLNCHCTEDGNQIKTHKFSVADRIRTLQIKCKRYYQGQNISWKKCCIYNVLSFQFQPWLEQIQLTWLPQLTWIHLFHMIVMEPPTIQSGKICTFNCILWVKCCIMSLWKATLFLYNTPENISGINILLYYVTILDHQCCEERQCTRQ